MASAPQKRTTKLHGISIEQTQLQGNWYTPVDERVKVAEQADPTLIRREGAGYHVVSVQIIQVAEKWAYHCMVEYPVGSGVIKPGTDYIDVKDATGIAKAETSAIGRALGLHGIAIETSIASADEMAALEESEPVLTAKHITDILTACDTLGREPPTTAQWKQMTAADAEAILKQYRLEYQQRQQQKQEAQV